MLLHEMPIFPEIAFLCLPLRGKLVMHSIMISAALYNELAINRIIIVVLICYLRALFYPLHVCLIFQAKRPPIAPEIREICV